MSAIVQKEIRRLELSYRLNNPGSAKIVEYAGFDVEGISRKKFKIGDELFDTAIAARLWVATIS